MGLPGTWMAPMRTNPIKKAKIPRTLKALPQWVVWRFVQRDGKNTKIPYDSRNPKRMASSTDVTTWGTFKEAVFTYQHQTLAFDGVGFVFSQKDPFTGVDLDKCRDAKTGELDSWAQRIVVPLDS